MGQKKIQNKNKIAGLNINCFQHAPACGNSISHDNFMQLRKVKTSVCPFTNGQICKRTNNLPIDK